ncbi:MAG: histidine phosphatase family protein [Clostridia bacterium]|nr:histidine phosphatase family protein [Clostridia bacterium]
MTVYLIRHGKTAGNLHGRYIGCRTDEPLCSEGVAFLQRMTPPQVRRVYTSPMKRCLETASILYPDIEPCVVEDFRECDFGAFEGLNYAELNGRADYQSWIDSGGEAAFPGGEGRASFARRSVRAFEALNLWRGEGDCALVVHGGTIMAVMEAFARPKGAYFDFQIPCGEGYALNEDGTYRRIDRPLDLQ